MIEKHKNLSVIAICFVILFVNVVSANGLTILNQTHFDINKTEGMTTTIEFQLKNEEDVSITFVDINFEDNNVIEMDEIDTLSSGDIVNVTATIIANQNFSGIIKIKGFYNASLGETNRTHPIDIDFYADEEISPCFLSIIKGETVKWNNICDMEIQLRNTDGLIATILPYSDYSMPFPTQMTWNYCLGWEGTCLPKVCQIIVESDTGLINDQTLDAILSLNVDVVYPLTDILVSTTVTDYEIEAGSSVENQILFIQNNGNNMAKSIFVSGDWFSFDENYFDLEPGDHKYVEYEIEPYITNTNETDKHYVQNISVAGNFETIIQSINIFIPYEENIIEDDYSDLDWKEKLEEYAELVRGFCNTYPDDSICDIITKNIIMGESNETDSGFSLEFIKSLILFMDRSSKEYNLAKTDRDALRTDFDLVLNKSLQTSQDVVDIKEDVGGYNSGVILLVMVIVTIVICGVIYYFIFHLKKKKNMDEAEKFY